ncbi:MAG: DUF1707 SHOCT-like domain-containing protein [Dermatophilaceae bacterium]
MTDAGAMRVGYEEREHVVVQLTEQCAAGRLTPDELQQRTAEARSARTFADLDRLVADLPVALPSIELQPPRASTNLSLLGTSPEHPLVLSAGMSSHVRRGVWTVPAYLSLSAGAGTVKLDFQQAICPHPVVDVAVSGGLGSIVLVLPEGWAANTDQIGKGIGSVSNKVDALPQPGKPLLVLHGSSAVGSVKVRHPSRRDRRLMRRALSRREFHVGPEAYADGAGSPAGPGQDGRDSGPQDAPFPPTHPTDGP